jgi:hypothetical protein
VHFYCDGLQNPNIFISKSLQDILELPNCKFSELWVSHYPESSYYNIYEDLHDFFEIVGRRENLTLRYLPKEHYEGGNFLDAYAIQSVVESKLKQYKNEKKTNRKIEIGT